MKNEQTMENEQRELAWITFWGEAWEQEWQPIMMNGRQLAWDDIFIMEICRERHPNQSWGISDTSGMLRNDAIRNNL